ncbi:MAG: Gfo/Idh/MocA family protein, partial [Candidatus Halalkalibacterium sp. M3_1C_030]
MSDSDQNNSKSNNRYSRRKFLKQSALGLGAAAIMPWPSFADGMQVQDHKYYEKWRQIKELPDQEKLNIALVGLGGYSTYQLAPALQQTKLCKLNGAVTGTPSKEDRWAKKYNIPEKNIYNYKTLDRIADNDDIDIVYVVTPNSLHPEYTIRAAEAGKHVISEKPMATSVE